jgi:hypothetical protein
VLAGSQHFVQELDGFIAATRDGPAEQLLQFVSIKPEAVTARATVHFYRFVSLPFDIQLSQAPIAARAKRSPPLGGFTFGVLKSQQVIVRTAAGAREKSFQFACIQPQTVTALAEVQGDPLEFEDQQGFIASGTDANHWSVLIAVDELDFAE